jgi:glycosyltransferase involved in cell wall biosynthesis
MHKISVILPTYNGATRGEGKYLKQAIESVFSQTYENFELIVVNDGSTDNTEEIIKQYKDERIVYLKHDTNNGPAAARNTGLKKATGEYIAFLDDDDYFYKDKLRVQISFMIEKDASVCVCNGEFIDKNNNKLRKAINKGFKIGTKDIFLYTNTINVFPTTLMVKSNVIEDVGYFKNYLKGPEDWDFMIRISLQYDIFVLSKILFAYRIHDTNLVKNLDGMFYNRLFSSYELKRELIKYVRKPEHYYFYNLHTVYYLDRLKEFRKFYKITAPLGKAPLEWKIKYICSYSIRLTKFLIRLKIKRMFSLFFDNY